MMFNGVVCCTENINKSAIHVKLNFQCLEQHKHNSINFNCIWVASDVSEVNMPKLLHIKLKLSA